jgi:hypothetical protein
MATTTPNFGWAVPTSTDLVKDGAVAIETLGDSIDASLVDLKGGTTNQVLAKNSNTDMDFKWVADASGIPATIIDAKGDLIAGTAADTASRLAVGANGTVLTADSAEATGLKWATPASGGGGLTLIKSQTIGTTVSSVAVTDAFSATYDSYFVTINNGISSSNGVLGFSLTGSSTGYYATRLGLRYSDAVSLFGANNNASSFTDCGISRTDGLYMAINLANPFLAKPTYGTFSYGAADNSAGVLGFANHQVASSFSGFTITPSTGTLTGGTIRVYGYQNS